MKCSTCTYSLWNIRTRTCPECGAGFKPSDFDFTLNSVQFCCPHCNQSYYGTGARGHLVPPAFACVSCGQHITMDECVCLPTQGVVEEQTRTDDMPWFERRARGVFMGWLATIGRAMVAPGRLMQTIPPASPAGFVFGSMTLSIFALVGIAPILLFAGFMAGVGPGGGGGPRIAGVVGGLGTAMAVAVLSTWVVLGIWTLVTHALLYISGGTPHTLRRTSQALGYSAGAAVLVAIPCVGPYFGVFLAIWWVVSATIMLAKAHNISGGRAAFATLTPVVVCIVAIGGFVVWTVRSTMNTVAAARMAAAPVVAPAPGPSALSLAQALVGIAGTSGAFPAHPRDMVQTFMVTSDDFFPITVPPTFYSGSAPTIGPRPAALRHGDYVFTYFGIDPKSDDPGLWIFVQSAAPGGVPRVAGFANGYHVGLLSGGLTFLAAGDEFDMALLEQNALRKAAGLPELPDPSAITELTPLLAPRE